MIDIWRMSIERALGGCVTNQSELAALFEKLGARNSEGWADSQISEGIPQLARFLFLRQAWRQVVGDGDQSWIKNQLTTNVDGPGGGIVPALKRLLSRGPDSSEDLTTVVRIMQWQLLHSLCYLLSDPGELEEEVQHIGWKLFQVDDDGNPIGEIGGLHESVLETEPNGQEMRTE